VIAINSLVKTNQILQQNKTLMKLPHYSYDIHHHYLKITTLHSNSSNSARVERLNNEINYYEKECLLQHL